ncbi:MAG: HesA/MoeB/ThiF family protein [Deltaproteobacteria bacterium]|nr:HesA/MoeB/ThiF family protein [Candidatus Anaeroferrophillus wilburensis]MBN2889411.1 HesA/MoeB/ThiF family protein [Deltaproteobacteria bacterium]
MPIELSDFLHTSAMNGFVSWESYRTASDLFSVSYAEIEQVALEQGLFPQRYAAHRQLIEAAGQLQLFHSRVAVIGCGGLGSSLVEGLARVGVGQMVIIDPDIFVESNLNRQFLATVDYLGHHKVNVAADRVAQINPAVTVTPLVQEFTAANGRQLLAGASVAVDALDSVDARLSLAEVCRELQIPLVHGAVAGWYGQVAVQLPGNDVMATLYRRHQQPGIEKRVGNLASNVAAIASLQTTLVVRILLAKETPSVGCWFSLDLRELEVERIDLAKE